MPDFTLHDVAGTAVLIVDRFDRAGDRRIGCASAMTMVEQADGEHGSYLDIAAAIETESPHAGRDLEQLWRRIVFSVLVRNTDDHLRNHGFLRKTTAGWSLSPAFDLNPDPRPGPKLLHTAIDYNNREARIDLALDVAKDFRLAREAAAAIVGEVVLAVDGWRRTSGEAGLAGSDADRMARAFEHDETERARSIAAVAR